MKPSKPAAQRGVFAILFAVLLVVILALAGLAIDIGFAYERHGDMKNYANVAALAAAHQLDGTVSGVGNAVDAAEDSVRDNTWGNDESAEWDESALTFGPSADGPWIPAGSVLALPASEIRLYRYARVDAGLLDASMATVVRYFPFGAEPANQLASVVSVAGPVMTQMLPLAVCAMSPVRSAARDVNLLPSVKELVEHGFRRGVTYNLLQLNPGGTEPKNYLVNPIDFPDSGGGLDLGNYEHDAIAPFVCSGTMAQPRTDQVYVREPFPTSLIPELNSRFGHASTCVATAALPDRNIKDFLDPYWLDNDSRIVPHAMKWTTVGGRLITLADVVATDPDDAKADAPLDPISRRKEDYGTLWAFVRPVRYSPSAANHAGVAFKQAEFKNLYPIEPTPNFITSWTDFNVVLPYQSTGSNYYEAPGGNSLRYRRVLHIPLLQCPVTGNSATILAVGKFLLTAPANATAAEPYIAAEFGGLVAGSPSSSDTRLYE